MWSTSGNRGCAAVSERHCPFVAGHTFQRAWFARQAATEPSGRRTLSRRACKNRPRVTAPYGLWTGSWTRPPIPSSFKLDRPEMSCSCFDDDGNAVAIDAWPSIMVSGNWTLTPARGTFYSHAAHNQLHGISRTGLVRREYGNTRKYHAHGNSQVVQL